MGQLDPKQRKPPGPVAKATRNLADKHGRQSKAIKKRHRRREYKTNIHLMKKTCGPLKMKITTVTTQTAHRTSLTAAARWVFKHLRFAQSCESASLHASCANIKSTAQSHCAQSHGATGHGLNYTLCLLLKLCILLLCLSRTFWLWRANKWCYARQNMARGKRMRELPDLSHFFQTFSRSLRTVWTPEKRFEFPQDVKPLAVMLYSNYSGSIIELQTFITHDILW